MYLERNSNLSSIEQKLRRHRTAPRMNIVKQLASKMLEELENVNETEKINFGKDFSLYEQIRKIEIDIIRHALSLTNNNQRMAAQMLGINNTTLNSKLKRYGI